MKKIAICWIGIGDYNIFFKDMYESFTKNFLTEFQRTFFIFTDRPQDYTNVENCVVYDISNACQHKNFILFRKWKYCLMAEDRYLDYDYVSFVNGNMVCKEKVSVSDVILNNKPISVISHPCGLITKGGTYNCDNRSLAAFCPSHDWRYLQAGFNISTTKEFLKMANTIEGWRHLDKVNGNDIYVPWHDETYANKYFYLNFERINVLDGMIYAFPNESFGKEYFDRCKIYTQHKQNVFCRNNIQYVERTSNDLYNITQYGNEMECENGQ